MTVIGQSPQGNLYPPAPLGAVGASGGGIVQSFTQGDWVDQGRSLAHLWNAAKTGIDGKQALGGELSSLFRAVKGLRGNAFFSSLKGLAGAAMPLMTRSAVFEAAISAFSNGVRLAQGSIGFGTFAGRLAGDTMCGFAGGAGAAIAGATVLAILPVTGVLGSIVAGVAGIGGYGLVAGMLRDSSLYRGVVGTIRDAFGGR
ncbi:MAG: hypothetical protein VKN33_04110 [Candidatus Sericytochromatia bacterium]|nr:hypothetical protein [Candidatus Sericytochromatia bacterium]